MSEPTQTPRNWQATERAFLWVFLTSRALLLWRRWGMSIGFDNDEHLEMVNLWSWSNPVIPIDQTFYAYHPPLGFLAAKTITLLGIHPVLSVQLASFCASLAAFFFLRLTLKHLRLLAHPAGIAFLYITSSIPLQLYLATSMNLDVFILAAASVVVYAATVLFWRKDSVVNRLPVLECVSIIVAIAVGMLTKFNGLLIAAIPFFTALLAPAWNIVHRRITAAAMVTVVGMALVAPYYYNRYYRVTGEFFPSNNQLFNSADLEWARTYRDADPWNYVVGFFLPSPAHAVGYEHRDINHARLSDTWKDLWISDYWLVTQPNISDGRPAYSPVPIANSMSMLYLFLAPALMMLGFIVFAFSHKTHPLWCRLGWMLLFFSGVQIAALVWFLFDVPLAYTIPTKAIYVAPILWSVGFFLATPFLSGLQRQPAMARYHEIGLRIVLGFMVVNHVLPVY